MFFLLCRHNDDGIFYDFLKIFDHSLKINENSLKLVGRSQERCRTCFEHFQGLPMVSKDAFCFLDNSTCRQFSSYSLALNYITIQLSSLLMIDCSFVSFLLLSSTFSSIYFD